MAKLNAAQRKALPKSDFALPATRSKSGGEGGYPIENKAHARNALARVAQHGSAPQKAEVRKRVHEKYPSIGVKNVNRADAGRHVPSEHLSPNARHFDAIGR